MRKRVYVLALALSLLLTGCGGSSYSTESASAPRAAGSTDNFMVSSKSMSFDEAMPEAAAEEADYSDNSTVVETGENVNPQQGRKLITTMNISAETTDLTETMKVVEQKVAELGGYIQSSDADYSSDEYGRGYEIESNYLVIRVPSEKLESFVY